MYASHIDQFIYKCCGESLNDSCNKYVNDVNIGDVVLAYRNNKQGKSNINFTAEVFQYVLSQEEAVIISLDFCGFFDNITYKELKDNIKTVLNKDEIPIDLYHVFKSTTQYSYVTKAKTDEFLLQKYGKEKLKKIKGNHQLKKISQILSLGSLKRSFCTKIKNSMGYHRVLE